MHRTRTLECNSVCVRTHSALCDAMASRPNSYLPHAHQQHQQKLYGQLCPVFHVNDTYSAHFYIFKNNSVSTFAGTLWFRCRGGRRRRHPLTMWCISIACNPHLLEKDSKNVTRLMHFLLTRSIGGRVSE